MDIIDLDNDQVITDDENASAGSGNKSTKKSGKKFNSNNYKYIVIALVLIIGIVLFLCIYFNSENRYSRQMKKAVEFENAGDYDNAVLNYRAAALIIPELPDSYLAEAKVYEKFAEDSKASIDGLLQQLENQVANREYENAIKTCDEISNDYAVAIDYRIMIEKIFADKTDVGVISEVDNYRNAQQQISNNDQNLKSDIENRRLEIMDEFKRYNMFEAIVSNYSNGDYEAISNLINSDDYKKLANDFSSEDGYIFQADEGIYVGIYTVSILDNIVFEDTNGDEVIDTPIKENEVSEPVTRYYFYVGDMSDSKRNGNGLWIGNYKCSYYTLCEWSEDKPNGNVTVKYFDNGVATEAGTKKCVSTTGYVVNGIYNGTVKKGFISSESNEIEVWDFQISNGRLVAYDGIVYGAPNGAVLETANPEEVKYMGVSKLDFFRLYGVDGFANEL